MRTYIFRDIFTARLYRVNAYTPMEALRKVAQARRIPTFNLARVQSKHASGVRS
jgi:hypothetical protein